MIFISASNQDLKIAQQLVDNLDYHEKVYLSNNEINIGNNFIDEIYNEIKQARAFILVVSKSTKKNNMQSTELSLILNELNKRPKQIKLIPIIVDGAEVPFFISNYKYIKVNKILGSEDIKNIINELSNQTTTDYNMKSINEIISINRKNIRDEKKMYEIENFYKQKKAQTMVIYITLSLLILTFLIISLLIWLKQKTIDQGSFSVGLLIGISMFVLGMLSGLIIRDISKKDKK
jgi:hypothetical protein